MQTIVSQLETAFRNAIAAAFGLDADPLLTVAQNEKFGDYQSNAAMGLAKVLVEKTGQKPNPRAVAEQIKAKLELGEMADKDGISIAGPGFINVRLSPLWLALQLRDIAKDERLGIELTKNPQTVVVDYSGPNIAKQMHVGHLRSTIIGDAFVRILSFMGHVVIRQNHVGDWGLQMGMVTFAVKRAGLESQLDSVDLDALEAMYKKITVEAKENPALRSEIIEATRKLQQTTKDQLTVWQHARAITLGTAQGLYDRLGVLLKPDDVRGESFYSDQYDAMVDSLRNEGVATDTDGAIGIFPPGFVNKENEPRPFIIQSRDGTYQYPTFDLAALRYRARTLHTQRIIYTHDDRQAEHFEMLFAVVKLLHWADGVQLDYAPFGTILGEDGKPFKTRSGDPVPLKFVLDQAEERALEVVKVKNAERPADLKLGEEKLAPIAHAVGIGAVKYSDLSKDRTSNYQFSLDKMLSFEGNTAPYMQFAYARIASIFRKAGGRGVVTGDFTPQLETLFEQSLAKQVLRFQEIIDLVARELKPHYLCTYLYELAGKFSSFYENCEVLKSEEPMRSSRLLLIDITRRTLALGLELLGIEHPEQM
ncbi:MAG TPA: arginine--tRNA ligase [Tepidisphaeraceae bacterium]|jgi:arginyl-tRNA synthetase|nr:arginine--tRNA ligase [Tepidisphaeraceae bacterium]